LQDLLRTADNHMQKTSLENSRFMSRAFAICFVVGGLAAGLSGQVTSGEILGLVRDPSTAGVNDAKITVRNLETNAIRETLSAPDGSFRFPQLPIGSYESTVEKQGFAPHVRGPILLRLNQLARLDIQLELATVTERVTVASDAPLLNVNNPEMGVNFDRRRISELPLAPNRNVLNLALSAPGVSQLQTGQNPQLSSSLPFSVNGMRTRSNNFMIDGQNSNQSILTGMSQPLNNPDIVAEFRLITNQFAPEYGRASGSIVNIVTKNGTNQLHGSAFWFHNDHHLNAASNQDQVAPFRLENQFGGTVGGPIIKDKTFFFGSLQRWTDRQQGGGRSFIGAPTAQGRLLLQSIAGTRPMVKILLDHVPPAQLPVPGKFAPVTVEGRTESIPLGSLSGSSNIRSDDWQWSVRVDHRFSEKLTLGGRYLANNRFSSGLGQVVPPGLTGVQPQHPKAASTFINHVLTPNIFHELRLSYQRQSGGQSASDPASERIPSVEVTDLGLTGNMGGIQRTAIGLPTDLPRSTIANRYQLQSTFGMQHGTHSMKFGIDFQRDEVNQILQTTVRGSLVYTSLQDLVDDVANSGRINSSLPGGSQKTYNKQYDYAFFVQDEWRIRPNLSLTYGIRYESPGNLLTSLGRTADRIVAASGGDLRFALTPIAPRDVNNWAPRFGFNYRFAELPGIFYFLTGNQALIVRGGYARTYDSSFTQVVTQVANSFPLVKSDSLPARAPNALETLLQLPSVPLAGNPNLLTRDLPPGDLRSPYADQFALQLQRELGKDWLFSLGYVGTKGTALFQQIDVNPTIPGTRGQRVDSGAGVRRMRCNCTSSIYHSLQTSLEKRVSQEFTLAAHYTWSSFIDGASDLVSPSPNGELQVAQDSYNRRADRARSSFDHPHRVTVNGVFELPFLREKKGLAGKIFGGWQASGFLTFQSGTPFTALDGADPGFRLSQLNATPRANVNTRLNLASLSVEEMYRTGGAILFSRVTASSPLGNIGRNILRSDGIGNVDLGLIKNTRITEGQNLQFRAEFYNASNTRNFGIPQGVVSSSDFLYQWGTDGGNRRIVLGLRYTF
jgi:Carboxypeptidase regulatory-like domain/TonB dependent receptor-like, beta-barrel